MPLEVPEEERQKGKKGFNEDQKDNEQNDDIMNNSNDRERKKVTVQPAEQDMNLKPSVILISCYHTLCILSL